MNITIRPANVNDEAFIFATWLRSYRYGNDFIKSIDADSYYEFHSLVIRRIRDRGASILVVADLETPAVIFGYMVCEHTEQFGPLLHFAYVKRAFRKMGLFKALLEASEIDLTKVTYTHQTKASVAWNSKFNPYLI